MLFSENLRVALRALRANTMRSLLTMLGIVIGVATVVALLAIGNGATSSITSDVQSGGGTNQLTISPGRQKGGMPGGPSQTSSYLYYSDYEHLQRGLGKESVTAILPAYQTSYVVKYQDNSFSVSVSGVTPQYAEVKSYDVAEGRFISDGDGKSQSLVAVLGSQTASDLFSGLSPIGRTISINGVKFDVIGVLKSKGSSSPMGSADDAIYIPLETGYTKLFGSDAMQNSKKTVSNITISVSGTAEMDTVSAQTTFILRRAHDLATTDEDDFTITNQADLLKTLSSITQTLTIFLGAIAGISLLVGGIGIMNIMLVSVTERTKEIGLRKAVGATRSQILMQFLIETVTLSLLGGIVGILLGVSIAGIFTALHLITAVVQASSIALAFGFALAIGVFFGLYPAYRAAGLHPMVALRYE